MGLKTRAALVAGILTTIGAVGAYTSGAMDKGDQAKAPVQNRVSSAWAATGGARSGENDALALPRTGISLAQAARAAEEKVNGRAVRAELERSGQGWVFNVETVANNMVYDVVVDPAKGTVISAIADRGDHGEHHGRHEDGDDDDEGDETHGLFR